MPGVVQLVFPPAPPRDDPGDECERSPRRRRGSDVSTEAPLPEPSPPDASLDPVPPKRKSTRAAEGVQNDFEQNDLVVDVLLCNEEELPDGWTWVDGWIEVDEVYMNHMR